MGKKLWIVLCLIALVAAIWLYTLIDSTWARESKMSILITIIFFVSAASSVLFAFNAVEANKEPEKE